MLSTISWGTYIFFAAFCLLAFAFTYFLIPETRGKVRTSSPNSAFIISVILLVAASWLMQSLYI